MWVGLQYLCYHNTFVSAIIHNTFATIPLSTIPYTGVPSPRTLLIGGQKCSDVEALLDGGVYVSRHQGIILSVPLSKPAIRAFYNWLERLGLHLDQLPVGIFEL